MKKGKEVYNSYKKDVIARKLLMLLCIYVFITNIRKLEVVSIIASVISVYCFTVLGMNRDYYLPFLDDTVLPGYLLKPIYPDESDTIRVIKVNPEQKVVFWASNPRSNDGRKVMPWDAYGDYDNSGVTIADKNGNATLRVRKPSSYYKPGGGKLEPHIHYRTEIANGMFSNIKTLNLKS